MEAETRVGGTSHLSASYFAPVVTGGVNIDLSHLEPFTFEVNSALAKKTLRVRALFSTHCFSHAYDPNRHPSGDTVIDEDTKSPRTFCPVRYGLSHALPSFIREMPTATVSQTSAVRNWVYSVTVQNPQGPYHVFFEIKRAPPEQRTWQDLNLIIESAYPEEKGPPAIRGKKPFVLVCGEAYTGNRRSPRKKKRPR